MSQGTIIKIKDNSVVVQSNCITACAGCEHKTACSLKNIHHKIVEVNVADASMYHIGQEIELYITPKTQAISIFFAYILPLIIVISALLIIKYSTQSDTLSAVGSLFVLTLYYAGLCLSQKWFKQRLTINIK